MSREAMEVRDAAAGYAAQSEQDVPAGYKRTEVGVIPEDWRPVRLDDCTEMLTGFPFSSTGFSSSGVRLLRGSNVKRGEIVWSDDLTKYWPSVTGDISKYRLRKGDLVIAMDGALVGRSYAIITNNDLPSLLVQRVARIRSKGVDSKLVSMWIGSDTFIAYVDSVKTHTAIPHISPDDIRNFVIAVPPSRQEQCAIATALSDVDALITALDRLIAKKRAIKTAAMQQLLTGKTRLPGFSGEWETKRLGDVAEIMMGQSPRSENYNTKGVGLPLIQGNADIVNHRTIKRVFTTEVTKLGKAGDVIMSVRAPVGEIAKATFDVCLGRGVCAIRFPNDFMYHYLIDQEPHWVRLSKGSTFESVNSDDIKALEVRLPRDINEQTAIAQVLSDMDAEIAALEARRDKTRAIKQGMMQELLTGRTRLVKPESTEAA